MKFSYIFTVYDRHELLLCALSSIMSQTFRDHEILVVDNHPDAIQRNRNEFTCTVATGFYKQSIRYFPAVVGSTYHGSNAGAHKAKGEFLCFPSEDSYYVPIFAQEHARAINANGWDLVYADQLYDRRQGDGKYSVMTVSPHSCHIDKTGFFVRRSKFEELNGFENLDDQSQFGTADGLFIEKCIQRGLSHGKIPEVFSVHN
jgi:glycosyltransferase involved in cell wall biosynthesis